jgi:hypothetical protein
MSKAQFTIECQHDAATGIESVLAGLADGDILRAEKDNLDGGLQTVILIAQTAAPYFAAVLPLLVPYLQGTKITRLKIKKPNGDEVEIISPTREQVEKWMDS